LCCHCLNFSSTEPTSGLDSTASLEVLQSLKDLSRLGVTVIAVIHQPRYSLFRQFDEVLLLGVGGRTVYQGKTSKALEYFTKSGFDCPANENPADFLLDVISGSIVQKGNPNFQLEDLFEMWSETFDSRVRVFNDQEKKLNLFQSFLSSSSNLLGKQTPVERKSNASLKSSSSKAGFEEDEIKALAPVFIRSSGRKTANRVTNAFRSSIAQIKELLIPTTLTEEEKQERMEITEEEQENLQEEDTLESHFLTVLPNHYQLLRLAFEKFDTDNDGFLNASDLQLMFESFGHKLEEDELKALNSALGIESNSSISLQVLHDKIDLAKVKMNQRVDRTTVLTDEMRLEQRLTPKFCTALGLMLKRGIVQYLRDAWHILFDVTLLIAFGAFAALVFGANWKVSDFPMICLLACLAIGLLGTNASLRVFGSERLIFWREASVGISIPAYFFSRTFLDLFQTVVYSYIFIVTFYNIIVPELRFAHTYTVFLVVYWYSSGLGILISLVVDPQSATLVGVIVPIVMGGFFSGLAPSLSSMQPALKAIAKLSYSRWGIEALCAAESDYLSPIVVSQMYYQGYEQGFDVVYHRNILFIFAIGLAFRVLAFFAILLFNRKKRQ
jgi:ABC-type multidrug transport system ATPase subunit